MGRLLLTLFYPGPGTGYLFALANMAVVTLVAGTLAVARYGWPWPRDIQQIVAVAWVGGAYVTFYVGLGLALSRVFSRHSLIGPITSLIVSWALVVLGALFPMIIQFSLRQYLVNGDDYTLIQLPNAFWTIVEIGDNVNQSWLGLLVTLMAIPVFIYNLVRLRVQNLTPLLGVNSIARRERRSRSGCCRNALDATSIKPLGLSFLGSGSRREMARALAGYFLLEFNAHSVLAQHRRYALCRENDNSATRQGSTGSCCLQGSRS